MRPRRFTLVELLTVIAIIAILMSMLAPSIFSALRRARALNCGTNLQSWGLAIESYATDFNEWFPGYTFWELNDRFTIWEGGYDLTNQAAKQANLRAFMSYHQPTAPYCPLRSEPRQPPYQSWNWGSGGWNVIDYYMNFGQGHMFPTDGRYQDGWNRTYWTAAYANGMGPTARRLDVRRENTPIMWDRAWVWETIQMDTPGCATTETCGYYNYGAAYNQISNHNRSGDRIADNMNVLALDGSVLNYQYNTSDAAWLYYGRDYYNRFWLHREAIQ